MKKQIEAVISLLVKGVANPGPPIGPSLASYGINIKGFCDQYNDRMKSEDKSMAYNVEITVYGDRSFDFIIKSPPVVDLIKKALGLSKGAGTHEKKIATLSVKQIDEIIETKKEELNAFDRDSAARIIAGTARSMGIAVEGAQPNETDGEKR